MTRAHAVFMALASLLATACDEPGPPVDAPPARVADAGHAALDAGHAVLVVDAGNTVARPWTSATPTRVCALATKISLGSGGTEIGAHVPFTLRLHFDGCAAQGDVDAGPCTTTVKGREVLVEGAAAVRAPLEGVDAGPCAPVSVTCKGPPALPGAWTIKSGAAKVSVRVPAKVPPGGLCSP